MRFLDFKKRRVGKSLDEWTELCRAHMGWVCLIDNAIYHIAANGVLILNEPYVPGAHGKAMIFRDWAKKALKEEQEWRIEEWQKSLKPLDGDAATASEDKSTSASSQTLSDPSDWTQSRLENTLSEVAEPGMCDSLMRVFGPGSSASDASPKAPSEPLPPTSEIVLSSGTPSGSMEVPCLPF